MIEAARQIQAERFKQEKIFANSRMNTRQIRKYCELDGECETLLKQAMTELGLSARAHDKILKVARTIADLDSISSGRTDGPFPIRVEHISEAIQYRSLDRALWK